MFQNVISMDAKRQSNNPLLNGNLVLTFQCYAILKKGHAKTNQKLQFSHENRTKTGWLLGGWNYNSAIKFSDLCYISRQCSGCAVWHCWLSAVVARCCTRTVRSDSYRSRQLRRWLAVVSSERHQFLPDTHSISCGIFCLVVDFSKYVLPLRNYWMHCCHTLLKPL